MSQGFRLYEKTVERVKFLADLKRLSASKYVAELIKNAPKVPEVGQRIQVSYGLDALTLEKLTRLANESGRSQGEVIEWLVSQN